MGILYKHCNNKKKERIQNLFALTMGEGKASWQGFSRGLSGTYRPGNDSQCPSLPETLIS